MRGVNPTSKAGQSSIRVRISDGRRGGHGGRRRGDDLGLLAGEKCGEEALLGGLGNLGEAAIGLGDLVSSAV